MIIYAILGTLLDAWLWLMTTVSRALVGGLLVGLS